MTDSTGKMLGKSDIKKIKESNLKNDNSDTKESKVVGEGAYIATFVKDRGFNSNLESSSEEVKIGDKIYSRTWVTAINKKAIRDNMIIRGTVKVSMLNISNKKLDDEGIFTYEVVATGESVLGVNIGDIVDIPSVQSLTKVKIDNNQESFEEVGNYYKKLPNSALNTEMEDYTKMQNGTAAKVRLVEYFYVSYLSVAGINSK